MSEQGNYNVLVEVKKTTIWLRKKDAEKPIDGRIKNQGVIMIENKIILIEDDKEIRGMPFTTRLSLTKAFAPEKTSSCVAFGISS